MYPSVNSKGNLIMMDKYVYDKQKAYTSIVAFAVMKLETSLSDYANVFMKISSYFLFFVCCILVLF